LLFTPFFKQQNMIRYDNFIPDMVIAGAFSETSGFGKASVDHGIIALRMPAQTRLPRPFSPNSRIWGQAAAGAAPSGLWTGKKTSFPRKEGAAVTERRNNARGTRQQATLYIACPM
jgi:hypothetical protein